MLDVSHGDVGGGLSLDLCSRTHFRSMELLHPDRRHDMISTPRLPRRRVIALGLGLGLGATAVSGVLPLPSPVVISAASIQGLSLGARGDAVAELQRALIANGVDVVGGADGVFGPKTLEALQMFQSSAGLAVSDVVAGDTLIALGLIESPIAGLAEGARGEAVKALQEALIAAGITPRGGADGMFGPGTVVALREWQTSSGLEASGVVDATTAARLLGGASSAPSADGAVTEDAAVAEADAAVEAMPGDAELLGLAYGDWGDAVAQVQELLIAAGVDVHGGADGLFGAATRDALSQFQASAGLDVSGRVDEATLSALRSAQSTPVAAAASHPYTQLVGLRPGALGEAVATLQQRLLDLGVRVRGGADGVFGPATADAVRSFQEQRGLAVDGIVDDATADALAVANADAAVDEAVVDGREGWAVYGERGSRVVAAQQALVDAGVRLRGGVDGVFGSATAAAVMDVQRANDLRVTGVIDAATAEILGLATAAVPADSPVAAASIDVFPVQGRCGFSDTWHAARSGGRLHLGVDIIAAEGNLVYAVTDGVITKVYEDRPGSLSGNGIRLTTEDGTYFFYAHFTHVAEGIVEGAEVRAGQVVGYIGSTGNSGTPHLHLEIHPQGGAAINPYPIVKAVDACHVTEPVVVDGESVATESEAVDSVAAEAAPAATDDTDADQAGVANTTEAAAIATDGENTAEVAADVEATPAVADDVAADAIGDAVGGFGPDDATPTGA